MKFPMRWTALLVVTAALPATLRAQIAPSGVTTRKDAQIAHSANFVARSDSTRDKPPQHAVLTGTLIGLAVGGMYGAMIGTTRPTQCLGGTGYCDVTAARTRHVLQWTGEGLVAGAALGAAIGETWSLVRSHRGT